MSFSKLRSSSLRLYPLTSLLFSCFAIFMLVFFFFFFFSSRRRHTRLVSDWSSDVCSSDLHRARGVRLDGGGGNPVEQRLLLGIEMHRMRVAHGVERITVFDHPAAAAYRYRAAVDAPRMQQAEVVAHLVRNHLRHKGTGAVDPCLVRKA